MEYIETSGTQYIYPIFGFFDKEFGLWKDIQPLVNTNNDNFPYFSSQNGAEEGSWYVFPPRWRASSTTILEWYWYKQTSSFSNVISVGDRYQSGVNWLGEKVVFLTSNGTTHSQTIGEGLEYSSNRLMLLGGRDRTLWYGIKISRGKDVTMDFVPVLNADGVPGMFDKKSKMFFENQGTGTFGYRIKRTGETGAPMSLRDPYYVPPSGVYARRAGENELEVLADTEETTGEGWEWFSNTGEAHEHFGITEQEPA